MKYHRLLHRQLKKIALNEKTHKEIEPFLEQINSAYSAFDNDLYQAETVLEKSSQELFLANKQLTTNITSITNQLRKIAGNIKDVIFEMDLQGNWTYLNPAWEKLTGHKIDDCLNQPFYRFLKNADKTMTKQIYTDKNLKNGKFHETIKFKTKCGIIKWLDISLKAVKSEQGEGSGYIGTIVDITNLKQTEIQLLKAKEKETHANKAKDDFLSTMSHEIRTPLNAVIGISHLLLIENPKPEQLENLKTLMYSSEHLLGLVNDILDFNKIASGSIVLEQADFSITHVLNALQSIFHSKAKSKNIRFKIRKDNALPEIMVGDSLRISQILTNLINNALKFTESGKVTLDIEVVMETEKTCLLEFEVTDTGIGIPEDKLETIFQSFAQANSDTSRKYGGTGLGLAICKRLLEIMDSDLKVESKLGKGTTFSFLLQLEKGVDTIELFEQRFKFDSQEQESFDLNRAKILVAEDNKVNIMVIEKFLIKWNVDYEIAENGLIALNKAKENVYDLILMDLQMPVMNGFEASTEIKESNESKNKKTPIYALSASTGADIKHLIKDFKIDGLICKPFNPTELYNKLSKVIKQNKVSV